MKRALRYDGVIPTIKNKKGQFEETTPEHIKEIKQYISENHPEKMEFDIIIEGETPFTDDAKSIVKPFADAGATWWVESNWLEPNLNQVLNRIKEGPPSLE
jgi:hypothetical protein